MEEKIREQIAMFRFSVIGPLISGELAHGSLTKQIKELCSRHYSIPYSNRKSIGAGTIEEWLYAYRYNNFEGLKPKTRSDLGHLRGVDETLIKTIADFRMQHPRMPLRIVINRLIAENKISRPAKPISTIYRHLRLHSRKRVVPVTGKEQKRFVHRYPNECWQGDVMHGNYIKDGPGPARKTYLVAFIDDATRLITGAQFFFSEETANIKEVLRTAVMTYGVPSKLYLDNGRNFTSHDIELACATMKCALIHSTAYYPEGKGKIERFFRTVRDSFLSGLCTVNSL